MEIGTSQIQSWKDTLDEAKQELDKALVSLDRLEIARALVQVSIVRGSLADRLNPPA